MPIPLMAIDPLTPDYLSDALKIVQIVFYVVAVIVAVLTYRAAVRGWLSPVNTEYQKRVMDRLEKMSEDLYAEFDPASDHYWPTIRPVHAAIEKINETFKNNRDQVLAEGKWYFGTPYSEDMTRVSNLLRPIVSDPFIPDNLREAVVDLLENRLHVLGQLYWNEFEKYADALAKGKQKPLVDPDDLGEIIKIHNRIVNQENKQGCGIAQIEAAVHEIRMMIQDYFDAFNPRGAGRRRNKFEG